MKEDKKDTNVQRDALYIVIGIILIITRLFGDISAWSIVDVLKLILGLTLIGFGVFKIWKRKAARSHN
jgi:hypothetical protein